MKSCKTCSVELTELNWQQSYQKRWYYLCKTCDNAKQRLYRATRPKRRFFRRYGLNETQYESMVQQSSGKCAICGNGQVNGKELCIDHCHTTGKVRGLLCSKCNMALGLFGDNILMLDRAKDYLNENL